LTSLASRIWWALVGVSVVLCFAFSCVIFFLVYVIEDTVFVNEMMVERTFFEKAVNEGVDDDWVPSNRFMKIYNNVSDIPGEIDELMFKRNNKAVEIFAGEQTAFLLRGTNKKTGQHYYLYYKVADVLAVRRNFHELFTLIGVVWVSVLSVAMFVAVRLVRTILSPLRKITDQLKDGHSHELPQKFSTNFSNDEVGILTRVLDDALARVHESANREFEFNRSVSHELRSPIQVAKSAVELLLENMKSSESVTKYPAIERLQRSIVEMQQIVEVFLWLASDKNVEEIEPSDVASIRKLVESLSLKNSGRSIELKVLANEDTLYSMPEHVLGLVISNLIRNAIAHAPESAIECVIGPNQIAVHDHGSFKEGTSKQGFGVGLIIVHRVCDRFKWRLNLIENESGGMVATLSDASNQAR